jgi:thymidine kinase
MNGYLELIIGPMFSGKTSKLIQIYNLQKIYNFNLCNIAVINYVKDTRYSNTTLTNHDKLEIPCLFCENLSEILDSDEIKNSKLVLINEGQFFKDLYDVTIELVEKRQKHVYIAGLDGDFKRNPFGDMMRLIPICDKIDKLHAWCANCTTKERAIFSHRINSSEDQVQIGGSDSYVPLCRGCYLSKNPA